MISQIITYIIQNLSNQYYFEVILVTSQKEVSTIPTLSQMQLDLFDLKLSSSKWKSDFYSRHIQIPIPMMIQQDYDELHGIDLIQALLNFVEKARDPSLQDEEFNKLALTNMMKNFDTIAGQSLPGMVTARFSDLKTKASIQKAYENLILLEVIYSIEKTLLEDKNTNAVKEKFEIWISITKRELTPSYFEKYIHFLKKIKNGLFGQSFESFFVWSSQTVPYFSALLFKNIWNGSRRLKAQPYNLIENLGLVTFQSLIIPAALLMGLTIQMWVFVDRLMILALSPLNYIKKLPMVVSVIYWGAYFSSMAFGFLKLYSVLPIMSLVTTADPITVLIVSAPILIYAIAKLSPFENKFLQNESPYMGHANLIALSLCNLFPWVGSRKAHELLAEINDLKVKYKGCYLGDADAPIEVLKAHPDERKLEIIDNVMQFIKKDVRSFIEKEFFTVNDGSFQAICERIKLIMAEKFAVKLPTEPGAQSILPPEEQYDRTALATKIFALQHKLDVAQKKYGEETANQIKLAVNPHVYLAQFERKSQLPASLQVLLAQPAVVAPENNPDENAVPEAQPVLVPAPASP